jgi:hypothetical protein
MIAPIRPQPPASPQLAGARRAICQLLMTAPKATADRLPERSRRVTWLFFGWVALVVFAYLARGRS